MPRPRHHAHLLRLASRLGVQHTYRDQIGTARTGSDEALLAAAQAMGCKLERPDDAGEALRAMERAQQQRIAEPVIVAWDGRLPVIPVRIPGNAKSWKHELLLDEEGASLRGQGSGNRVQEGSDAGSLITHAGHNGTAWTMHKLSIRRRLPMGYHRLRISAGDAVHETLVLSAPRRFWAASPHKELGVFAPWYALHSRAHPSCGTVAELGALGKWARGCGCSILGTLPMLATYLDEPFEPSPYSPVSRLFWSELIVDTAGIRGHGSGISRGKGADLDVGERLIDYRTVARERRRLLEKSARGAFESREQGRAIRTFARQHEEVEAYARFRAALEKTGRTWRGWPRRMHDGDLRDGDFNPKVRDYHLFVQWLAHQQLCRLSESLRREGVEIYLDLPLGVHGGGYDVWRHQRRFALEMSVGAPPDMMFSRGQDWGFPPPLPQEMREDHHRYFIQTLRNHLQFARVLRIDHVMGLHRLFWVPHGMSATDGLYVKYPADEHYAILSIETHRHRARIVGENLGTVPPEVNRDMKKHGMLGMYVGIFSFAPDDDPPLHRPGKSELASLGTHDTATFTAFWEARDVDQRVALDLLTPKEAKKERAARKRLRAAAGPKLARIAATALRGVSPGTRKSQSGDAGTAAALAGALAMLAKSPAPIVLTNLEDLWLEDEPQNVPGTTDTQHPNWRRRMRVAVDELQRRQDLREVLLALAQLRHRNRRSAARATRAAASQGRRRVRA